MKLTHPEVRIETTNICNATCIMCPRDSHTREQGIMNQETFEYCIDQVVPMGAKQVVLTGYGEPLLDKGLEQKIAYAKSHSLRTYVISNGSALTENRAYTLLQAGLDELRISFYGMQPKTYNAVMQGLDYDKTVKGLMTFLSVKKTLEIDCKVQLSFLILPENEEDTQAFKDFWLSKVDYLEIWKPHNFGDGRNYRERTNQKRTCGRPANGPLQIQWDGSVIPCCYDYNNQIILGDIANDSIEDILKSERYNLLRAAHEKGEFWRFPYCDQCDQLLPHDDALVFTNRHSLEPSEAVKLSNTDLYKLE